MYSFDSGCGDMVCKKEEVDWLKEQNLAENILIGIKLAFLYMTVKM